MRPNHIRVLLDRAREQRLEFVYGRIHDHYLDRALGVFPPRCGEIALQASLVHSSLRFFEYELADADFNTPNDMGLVDRMLRAGVRCGTVEAVVADYFPSHRGHWAPSRAMVEAQWADER